MFKSTIRERKTKSCTEKEETKNKKEKTTYKKEKRFKKKAFTKKEKGFKKEEKNEALSYNLYIIFLVFFNELFKNKSK